MQAVQRCGTRNNMKFFKSKADKKRDAFVKAVADFANESKRKETLIIMGDPETDVLVASYKGLVTAVHRKRNISIVRNLVDLNHDTREGDLLNQFIKDLAYMVVGLGDQLQNERMMRRGLAKVRDKAQKSGQPMVQFGATDEKGNTKEVISVK